MKHINLLRAANARLRCAAALCLLVASYASASAQTRGETQAPTPAPARSAGPTADEDFELNIDSRRISAGDFHAETAVEAGGERGLRLKIGVALAASDIEALLTGVRGRVRFRASLAPVQRLLDSRRGATPAASPTGSPP